MSVTNVRTEVQVAKSESPDNRTSFPVRDQQYQKFADNNQQNYSGNNVLFDLQSIANSQQFLSFADSFIIVPVVEHITFTGDETDAKNKYAFDSVNTRLISTIKGTAVSILNGIQLEVNNEQILSYTNGAHVPMEFLQISSYSGEDFALGVANDAQYCDAKDQAVSVEYMSSATDLVSRNNIANSGTPWFPLGTSNMAFTTTGTTNNAYYKKLSTMVSTARNDVVTAFYAPSEYLDTRSSAAPANDNIKTQLDNSRISYVDVKDSAAADSASGIVGTFYYFLKIPLPIIHDFFKQAPLMKGVSLRLTLYVHLPLRYTFTGTSVLGSGTGPIPTTQSYKVPVSETLVNTTGYMPFTLSYPGPEGDSPTCVYGDAPAEYTYTIDAGIASIKTSTGVEKKSYMSSCEFWAKLVTLSAAAETAILREPKKTIIFQDFQRVQQAQMLKIDPNAQQSFNVHSGIRRPRGLLITSESFQCPTSYKLPYSSSAIVSTGGVPGLPFFTQSNLQIRLGGKNIWNWNLQYGYDLFEREIRGLNNAAGNMENALRTGSQIAFNNWLRQNGYVFVDLSKHVESEDNSYFSIDMDITNKFALPLSLVCYIFYEKEVSINVQTGQLFA